MKKSYEAPVLVSEPVVLGVFGAYNAGPVRARWTRLISWLFRGRR